VGKGLGIGAVPLGRFLSPDPVVQSPGYNQSYNRYSYCFNNPLKYIDHSGYNAWKLEENPMHFGSDSPNYNPYSYQGYMGPGSRNYWSDGLNSYMDWCIMFSSEFDNFYGEGAYDQACIFNSSPSTQDDWRSGRIDMHEVMTYHKYWNPIAGNEVYRKSKDENGVHYVFIYYEGAWISLENNSSQSNEMGTLVEVINSIAVVSELILDSSIEFLTNSRVGSNMAYRISYNKLLVKGAEYVKPISYGTIGIVILTDIFLSTNINPETGKPYQSWNETIANTAVTGAGLTIGGWTGIVLQLDYISSKEYMKAIIEHPERSPYPFRGFYH
jgi:hypothetical protein